MNRATTLKRRWRQAPCWSLAPPLTQATNDKEQIVPMLEALSQRPECLGSVKAVLADTGFQSMANVNACEDKGMTPMIAAARENPHPDPMERFTEPPPCPRAPRRYRRCSIA